MSWTGGGFARRCWSPTRAMARLASSARGWTTARSRYVVQVKADTSAYPEQVRPTTAPYTGKGRRPRPRYRDKPASLKQLRLAAGRAPAWT